MATKIPVLPYETEILNTQSKEPLNTRCTVHGISGASNYQIRGRYNWVLWANEADSKDKTNGVARKFLTNLLIYLSLILCPIPFSAARLGGDEFSCLLALMSACRFCPRIRTYMFCREQGIKPANYRVLGPALCSDTWTKSF